MQEHGCNFSSWPNVTKISNQTVHHQSWLNLNPCCTYKKLPACKTAKILTAFLILRKKKSIIVFNHGLIISLWNTVIEKTIKAWKTEYEDRQVLGNLCRAVRTKHLPWCFSHIKSAFFKTKLPKIHQRCCIKNSWENITQLSDFSSEFVIFLIFL